MSPTTIPSQLGEASNHEVYIALWWLTALAPTAIAALVAYFTHQQTRIYRGQLKISEAQLELSKGQTKIAEGQVEVARAQLKVAEGQADDAKRKLKMDLFDRRWRVFYATRAFLWSIIEHGKLTQNEWAKFNISTDEGEFLFGDEVSDFLKSLTERGRNILFPKEAATDTSQLTSKLLEEQHQLRRWFKPYLDITSAL